jgi:hypothetical protein
MVLNISQFYFRLLTFTSDSWLTLGLATILCLKYIFFDSDPQAETPKIDSSSQTVIADSGDGRNDAGDAAIMPVDETESGMYW